MRRKKRMLDITDNSFLQREPTVVEKEIDCYVISKETCGCLLLSGPWGAGKTFLLSRYKSNHSDDLAIGIVSLFGIGTVEQLHQTVKECFVDCSSGKVVRKIRRLCKKTKKLIEDSADIASSMASGATSATIQGAKTVMTFDFLGNLNVSNEIKMSNKKSIPFILVFDDFERCDISMIERMGAINEYVENRRIKTIILSAEDKILEPEYKEFKEKVVSRTIRIKTKPSEVVNSIIETVELQTPDYRNFVRKNKDEFIASFNDSNYMNYRMLKCCICDFERVYETWKLAGTAFDLANRFIYEFCAREYESKVHVYVSTSNNSGFVLNDYSVEDTPQGRTVSKTKNKYREGTFTWDFYSVSKWIVEGEWDSDLFEKELLQKYAYTKIPSRVLLTSEFWSLEQSDVDQGLPTLLKEAYQGELSRDELIALLKIIHELHEKSVSLPCEPDYSKIQQGLNTRIHKIKEDPKIEPESHHFLTRNQVDDEAIPVLNQVIRMENRVLAWEQRNAFILICSKKMESGIEKMKNQYLEEFDEEMLDSFLSGYTNSKNAFRFALTRLLLGCIFDFSECSDEDNISCTILSFTKLINELKKLLESQDKDMAHAVITETIRSCEQKKEHFETVLAEIKKRRDAPNEIVFTD